MGEDEDSESAGGKRMSDSRPAWICNAVITSNNRPVLYDDGSRNM